MKRILAALVAVTVIAAVALAVWPRSHPQATPSSSKVQRDADNSPPPTRPPAPSATTTEPRPTAPTRVITTPVKVKPAVQKPAQPPPKYLALFVLDGARPDYFTLPGLRIPNLRSLMQRGTQFTNGFAGILESETPSGHATIGSGSTPKNDGILSFAWANDDNTTVNLFDPNNIRNHQMENILQKAPAPTIAGLLHRKDPNAKVVVLGGHKYYAQDAIGGPDANVIIYYAGTKDGKFGPTYVPGHAPPPGLLASPLLTKQSTHLPVGMEDHTVMQLAARTVKMMRPRALLANIPEFDWPLGHPDGAIRDPQEAKILLEGFDRDIGSLEDQYRKAGILNQTVFVITADHGFAPIYHKVDKTPVDNAIKAAGTDVLSDTYHTAAYVWLKDSTKASAAAANVSHLMNPYIQSVYFKTVQQAGTYGYLRASGPDLFYTPAMEAANQYLLNTFAGSWGPDVVIFFTEESGSLPGGEATWKGDHGGAAWESQHMPLIISGPGIRQNTISNQPTPLMDIAPTLLYLFGAPRTGMEGTPLTEALMASDRTVSAARAGQTNRLTPVVRALQTESRAEVAVGK